MQNSNPYRETSHDDEKEYKSMPSEEYRERRYQSWMAFFGGIILLCFIGFGFVKCQGCIDRDCQGGAHIITAPNTQHTDTETLCGHGHNVVVDTQPLPNGTVLVRCQCNGPLR